MGNSQSRQTGRNSPETRSDRFHGQLKKGHKDRSGKEGHDVSWHSLHVSRKDDDHYQGQDGKPGGSWRQRVEVTAKDEHASEEFARDVPHADAEEVLDLRAGDQHRDAVGETQYDRAGNEVDQGSQAGGPQNYEQDSRHQRAHKQAVQAVSRHDAVDDHDERPRWTSNLSGGPAQKRDQEAGYNRAVKSRLRRDSRGDGKRHG